jgi:hypothetical protein
MILTVLPEITIWFGARPAQQPGRDKFKGLIVLGLGKIGPFKPERQVSFGITKAPEAAPMAAEHWKRKRGRLSRQRPASPRS